MSRRRVDVTGSLAAARRGMYSRHTSLGASNGLPVKTWWIPPADHPRVARLPRHPPVRTDPSHTLALPRSGLNLASQRQPDADARRPVCHRLLTAARNE